MKLKKVRKIIKDIVKKRLPPAKDDYYYTVTEFADKTYQLDFTHSFDGGQIKIQTPSDKTGNHRTVSISIFDKDENIIYCENTGIDLGREIT